MDEPQHTEDLTRLLIEFYERFSSWEQAVVREVLLCLDIPQVPAEQQPFQRMCELAQELAKKMEGTVIDGNGYRIDSVAMEGIGKDVEDLYLLLAQRDFHAGSVLARVASLILAIASLVHLEVISDDFSAASRATFENFSVIAA